MAEHRSFKPGNFSLRNVPGFLVGYIVLFAMCVAVGLVLQALPLFWIGLTCGIGIGFGLGHTLSGASGSGRDIRIPKTGAQSTVLSCEQCRELLSGYVDRELTSAERQSVERHLASCTLCATDSTQMVDLKKVLQDWGGIEGSTEFSKDVMQKIVTESRVRPSKQLTE